MDKKYLLQLLADNQVDALFDALKNEQGYYRDLVLLESKWNDLREKQRNGLVSEEQASLELAQVRSSLMELIEQSTDDKAPVAMPAPPTRKWMYIIVLCVGVFILYEAYRLLSPSPAGSATGTTERKPLVSRTLNTSEAHPVTMAAGDAYYEHVYSVVNTSVESTGGGKSLVTLTVGYHFKGRINGLFSTNNFRLLSDELPGPLEPSNYLGKVVGSKSYQEGDIKFELSDAIRRFSIVIEGQEDKKWLFSR